MSSDDLQEIKRGFEINFSSILTSLILGAIIFSAAYLFNNRAETSVLSNQISVLQTLVSEMRQDLKTMQNNGVRREEYQELKNRVERLENRK